MELDSVDKKILSLMREDARLSFQEIGKKVYLSPPAVHARVKKLEKAGVIQRYTVALDPRALEAPLCAFIRIRRNKGSAQEVVQRLQKVKEVEECHSVAGEDCMLVKLRAPSSLELAHILDQVRAIEGVDRTVTMVVLDSHFERGLQP